MNIFTVEKMENKEKEEPEKANLEYLWVCDSIYLIWDSLLRPQLKELTNVGYPFVSIIYILAMKATATNLLFTLIERQSILANSELLLARVWQKKIKSNPPKYFKITSSVIKAHKIRGLDYLVIAVAW